MYPDAIASRIIEQDIRPLVNSGDFAGAVKIFYEKSAQVIGGEYANDNSSQNISSSNDFVYLLLFFGFVFGSLAKNLWKKKLPHLKKSSKKILSSLLVVLFMFMFLFGIFVVGSALLMLFIGFIL